LKLNTAPFHHLVKPRPPNQHRENKRFDHDFVWQSIRRHALVQRLLVLLDQERLTKPIDIPPTDKRAGARAERPLDVC
jgi:hypothetical protein